MGLTISPQEVWANHPAPTLEAPANNACTADTTPNFNWADVSGAVSYKLEVDQDNQFTPPIFYSPTNPTSSNHNNAGPFPQGTYFWHVATQGSGTGHALGPFNTVPFSFTVDTSGPVAPTSGSPGFTNDQTPLLTWSPSTDPCGVNRYIIEASTSSTTNPSTGAFSGTIVSLGGSPNIDGTFPPGPTPQKQVTTTLNPGTYFWHVRARDTLDKLGPFSNTFTLVIDTTIPAAPTITSPTAGTQNTAISSISGTSGEADLTIEVFNGATSLGMRLQVLGVLGL